MVTGSDHRFNLAHFTGERFLQNPVDYANLQSLEFNVQRFPTPNTYSLSIYEATENGTSSVLYTVRNGVLTIEPLSGQDSLMGDEQAQQLSDFFGTVMPQTDLEQPQEIKQIT